MSKFKKELYTLSLIAITTVITIGFRNTASESETPSAIVTEVLLEKQETVSQTNEEKNDEYQGEPGVVLDNE